MTYILGLCKMFDPVEGPVAITNNLIIIVLRPLCFNIGKVDSITDVSYTKLVKFLKDSFSITLYANELVRSWMYVTNDVLRHTT